MIIKLKASGDRKIYKELRRFNLSKNGRARGAYRRTVRSAAEKTWANSIRSAGIRIRTGRILRLKFEYPTTYTIRMIPLAPHAKFFWFGTRKSRGRWIKYIRIYEPSIGGYKKAYLGKRFRKDRISYYMAKYGERFVGWHPGISTSKFPLRRLFSETIEKDLSDALKRFLKRWADVY